MYRCVAGRKKTLFLEKVCKMAEVIPVADMCNKMFQAYYDELCLAHSVLYADFMLGVPETVTVRWHSDDEMNTSFENKTCVDCHNEVTTDLELCSFETIDDSGTRHSFYLCCQCQKCQPSKNDGARKSTD